MSDNSVHITCDGGAENNNGAPEWMDKLFVHKCLQNYFVDKKITIHSFDVKPGTSKGDNYASYIYRVTVLFTDGRNDEINVCDGMEGE